MLNANVFFFISIYNEMNFVYLSWKQIVLKNIWIDLSLCFYFPSFNSFGHSHQTITKDSVTKYEVKHTHLRDFRFLLIKAANPEITHLMNISTRDLIFLGLL